MGNLKWPSSPKSSRPAQAFTPTEPPSTSHTPTADNPTPAEALPTVRLNLSVSTDSELPVRVHLEPLPDPPPSLEPLRPQGGSSSAPETVAAPGPERSLFPESNAGGGSLAAEKLSGGIAANGVPENPELVSERVGHGEPGEATRGGASGGGTGGSSQEAEYGQGAGPESAAGPGPGSSGLAGPETAAAVAGGAEAGKKPLGSGLTRFYSRLRTSSGGEAGPAGTGDGVFEEGSAGGGVTAPPRAPGPGTPARGLSKGLEEGREDSVSVLLRVVEDGEPLVTVEVTVLKGAATRPTVQSGLASGLAAGRGLLGGLMVR